MKAEPLNRPRLQDQLILHEALRLTPYRCTSGKLTIGVGYNVDDRGLAPLVKALGRPVTMAELQAGRFTRADALRVLDADITTFEQQIRAAFPLYDRLNDPRKRALVDFVFNIGVTRAKAFRKAIDALTRGITATDARVQQAFFWETAWHAMDSLWARQVDDGLAGTYGRADRVANMLGTGKDYTK